MEIREVNPNDIEELALLSVTMKQEARDFSHVRFTSTKFFYEWCICYSDWMSKKLTDPSKMHR